MTRGRVPKSVLETEAMATRAWAAAMDAGRLEVIIWRDIEGRMFGAGEILRAIGQRRASDDAFFLASLAGHLARGDLAVAVQCDAVEKMKEGYALKYARKGAAPDLEAAPCRA